MKATIGYLALLLAGIAAAAPPVPCTTAAHSCMEKVPLGPAQKYSWIYRSFPLNEKNESVRSALVVIHGAGRNADSYFASATAAALLAGAQETSLLISPRFASKSGGSCDDKLDAGEISWLCGDGEDWRGGGAAEGISSVNTFDLIDDLLRKLARRDVFPNLRVIVVTGHSAGGQFVARYAATSRAENQLGVPVHYIVANPSSYLYLDSARLAPGATCAEKGGCTGEFRHFSEGRNCTTFNQWRYGLEKRNGAAASVSDEDLRRQLTSRDVTYLLGEFDTLPVYGFDGSCPAMAQGPSRLARGITYWNYLRSKYSAQHKLVVVPACGHNGRCMYTADIALPLLFPK
jgi:pimeloyl-ACP methyl ester carboxylesterase